MNMVYSIRIVLDQNHHGTNGRIGQIVQNRVMEANRNESENVYWTIKKSTMTIAIVKEVKLMYDRVIPTAVLSGMWFLQLQRTWAQPRTRTPLK